MLEGRYPAEFRRRQELTGPEGGPIKGAVDDLVSEVRSLRQAEPIEAAVVEGGSARVERLTTPGALPHVRGHLRFVGDDGRGLPTPWRGQRRPQLTLVGSLSPPPPGRAALRAQPRDIPRAALERPRPLDCGDRGHRCQGLTIVGATFLLQRSCPKPVA